MKTNIRKTIPLLIALLGTTLSILSLFMIWIAERDAIALIPGLISGLALIAVLGLMILSLGVFLYRHKE